MKFFLFLIVISLIGHISNSRLDPVFLTKISGSQSPSGYKSTFTKFIIPEENKIEKVDTRLLIRVSTPDEGLKGSYSFNPGSYFNFEADENDSFIIVKFGEILQSYNIRNALFMLKSRWSWNKSDKETEKKMNNKPKSTGTNLNKNMGELLVICQKNENSGLILDRDSNSENEYLVLSFPTFINSSNTADINSSSIINENKKLNFDEVLSEFIIHFGQKFTFPFKKLINQVNKKFYFYKNTNNNDEENIPKDIINYFIFKDGISISPQIMEKLQTFSPIKNLEKEVTSEDDNDEDFRKYNLNKGKKFLRMSSKSTLNNREFVGFADDKNYTANLLFNNKYLEEAMQNNALDSDSISVEIIEIDPDDITKSYIVPKRKFYSLKFDLESFNVFLKAKHGDKTVNIYDKVLVGDYLKHLSILYNQLNIEEDKIKSEFELIYERFCKKKEIEKNNKMVLDKLNSTNTTNYASKTHNSTIRIKFSKNNIKNNNFLEKIKIANTSNKNTSENMSNSINKTISDINNHDLLKSNSINNTHIQANETSKEFDSKFINTNQTSSSAFKNTNSSKITLNNLNNKQSQKTVNKTKIKNHEIKPNITRNNTNFKESFSPKVNVLQKQNTTNNYVKKIDSQNGNKNVTTYKGKNNIHNFNTTEPLFSESKFKKKTISDLLENKGKFSPFLKNEKIRYVNGSLVLIQTLMLGNKDEKLAEMRNKFDNLLRSE